MTWGMLYLSIPLRFVEVALIMPAVSQKLLMTHDVLEVNGLAVRGSLKGLGRAHGSSLVYGFSLPHAVSQLGLWGPPFMAQILS